MRALKSILGTALFHESRLIGGARRTLADVVTDFLAAMKARAEAQTGTPFARVLSGRPVHFHTANPGRDERAQADLRACYLAAGFDEVSFLFEPEAAARNHHGPGQDHTLGLIVDIGGGTSDFSVFRAGADGAGGVQILASHGIRLGGTDFDREVSMRHVMGLLGHGGQLRRTFGPGLLPVPKAIYWDLATWAKIPFLYSRDTERAVADLHQNAVDPAPMARLGQVIEHQLGHEVAFAVERGKIAANGADGGAAIALGMIAPGLSAPVTAASLDAALAGFEDALAEAIEVTLSKAGIQADDVDTAVLVGGSSLMALVPRAVARICPGATLEHADAFTAVVDGLARATAEMG